MHVTFSQKISMWNWDSWSMVRELEIEEVGEKGKSLMMLESGGRVREMAERDLQ